MPEIRIHRLYAELVDAEPKIWRRFEAASSKTVAELAYFLMIMFEMQGSHLFSFQVDQGSQFFEMWKSRYGEEKAISIKEEPMFKELDKIAEFALPDEEAQYPNEVEFFAADKEKVNDLFLSPGYEASFRYDFGDGWEVRLVCESTDVMTISARELPRVLEGEGYGIIEDCGGPGGLEQLRKAFKKKKGEDYEMYVEWLGVESLDLTAFNKDDINFRLKKLPRVYKDMYEHHLYPTQQSVDLLERKYLKKKTSGWMPLDQS